MGGVIERVRLVYVSAWCPLLQNDMDNMTGLAEVRQEIMKRVLDVISKVLDFRNSLDTYAYLWVEDRAEFLKHFLQYGQTQSSEEMDTHANDEIPEQPPTLEQFKEQARKSLSLISYGL